MAQTVLTADIIAKAMLAILDNELGVLGTLYRAPEEEFTNKVNGYHIGETISINRPADFTIRTGATMDTQDVIEGKVALTIDTQKGVDFKFTSKQMTLDISELSDRVLKPATINLVNDVAQDVFNKFYQGVYNWAGTPGQTVNSFTDFTKAPERLDEMAVMRDSRHAVMSPADHWGMVGSNTNLQAPAVVTDALRQGNLGMLAGMETWMSQIVPTHTNGTWDATTPLVDGAAQTVTYDTAKNTWTQSLITDGWDASATITAGSVFTIADVFMVNPKTKAATDILQQFVVTTAVTANATTTADTTLTIAPPIITSGPHQTVNAAPADDAAITPVGAASTGYKQNLAYHKNAMALAVVPMEIPAGSVNVSRQTRNGLSIRVEPVRDGINDVNKWRTDILYGVKLVDPRIATRFSGTA
jgi:hypothetical protein